MLTRILILYELVRFDKRFGSSFAISLVLISITGNACCFYYFDNGLNGKDFTFGDALWYSFISITTIGYGDYSAESTAARLGTFFFIGLLGLATFTIFLGSLVEWAAEFAIKGQKGLRVIMAKNHVLLINFPSAARVRSLIEEMRSEPDYRNRTIIVVTDQVDSLPFDFDNIRFVHGSPIEKDTYDKAHVDEAAMALVLATSYGDANSDAIVSAAVSVIDSLKPSIHIVAECLDEKHKMLFESVRCDAIVPSLKIAGNLLVQEIQDPGISQMIGVFTSNKGATLFSLEVGAAVPSMSYGEIAKRLLDHDVNLLSINRGPESLATFRNQMPQQGDRMIYIADNRVDWDEFSDFTKV